MLARALCAARAGRSSGSGCGRRWRRSRPPSGCSWRCPGSGFGFGCRRSAGRSGCSCSSCWLSPRPCRCSSCAADRDRGAAAARSGEPAAAPAGHRHRRPDGAGGRRSVRSRALARACRARAARGACAQGRHAGAAAVARAIPIALRASGADPGGRNLLRRRQRALSAHRRRLRLARRGGVGELPDRCLGDAAGLYRPAAADPARACGPASRLQARSYGR